VEEGVNNIVLLSGVTLGKERKLFSDIEQEDTQNYTVPKTSVAYRNPFKRTITI